MYGYIDHYMTLTGSTPSAITDLNMPVDNELHITSTSIMLGSEPVCLFASLDQTVSPTDLMVYAYIGTTQKAIDTYSDFVLSWYDIRLCPVVDGSDLVAMYSKLQDGVPFKLMQAVYNGSGFDAPEVYYDVSLNPPNVYPPIDQYCFGFSAGHVGSIGSVVSMYGFDGTPGSGIGYYLNPLVVSPPSLPIIITDVSTVVLPNPIRKRECYDIRIPCEGIMQTSKMVTFPGFTRSLPKGNV